MNSGMLDEFGEAWWSEAKKKVKNAVVFLDPISCETLHWNGGAPLLMEAGATAIREFSTFEVVPENCKKAVFIIASAFQGTNLCLLKSLISKAHLSYCVLITSAHVSVHHHLKWGGTKEGHDIEAFQKLEEEILQWMGNLNYTAEIFNYPLCTIHPTKGLFLMPSAQGAHSLLPNDLHYINEKLLLYSKGESSTIRSLNDMTFGNLPLETQAQIRQMAHNLNQILHHINAREDVFTVGPFSRIVGSELESLNAAKNRRKTAINKMSVIIVDRVLDLVSATDCSSSSLYDRLLHSLPRLHDCSNDVAITMSNKAGESDMTCSPGCLAPQQIDRAESSSFMDWLFDRSVQKGTEQIRAALTAASGDDDFERVLQERSSDWNFIEENVHLLQIAAACARMNTDRMDNLLSLQKGLVQLLDDPGSPSPLNQILHLTKSRHDEHLSLDDIILLLVHLYSLDGERETMNNSDLEDRLKSILAESLVYDAENLSPVLQQFVGVPVDEIKAHRAALKLVDQLHSISAARSCLKRYKDLHQRLDPALPVQKTSLFKMLVEDIFDHRSTTENPDLEHKSGGLKDLLKTGFSLFVNVRKPRPSDNPVILFFVCGGIRPDEFKLIRDLFRTKAPSHDVIVGSSHLISAHDMLYYALKKI